MQRGIRERGARLLRASAGVRSARRPHAVRPRCARPWRARLPGPYATGVMGTLEGFSNPPAKGLRRAKPAEPHAMTGRGPLSRLAGARARTLAALVYAASGATPAARAPSLTSPKPQPRATELDEREVVARSLLVPRGGGAKALEPVEEDLDQVALPIKRAVQPMFLLSLGL